MIENTHIEYESEVTTKESLRNFALVWIVVLILWTLWVGSNHPWAWYVQVAAASMGVLALAIPTALYWPYRAWMFIGAKLSWVMTRVLLALVFFGVITPLGLLRRILKRRSDTPTTFWHDRKQV